MIKKPQAGDKCLTTDGRPVTVKEVYRSGDGRTKVLITPGNTWVTAWDLKRARGDKNAYILEGKEAYQKGVNLDDNPYPNAYGSKWEHNNWHSGWLDGLYEYVHSND